MRELASVSSAAGGVWRSDSNEQLEEALLSAVTAFTLQVIGVRCSELIVLHSGLNALFLFSVGAALDRLLLPTACWCEILFHLDAFVLVLLRSFGANCRRCAGHAFVLSYSNIAGLATSQAQCWLPVTPSAAKNITGCCSVASEQKTLFPLLFR